MYESVCKAVQNCTALHTLLMMTAEFMLSKRPVLRFTAALFFLLKLFSSHIYCNPDVSFTLLLDSLRFILERKGFTKTQAVNPWLEIY